MTGDEVNLAKADEVLLELFNVNQDISKKFEKEFPKHLLDFSERFTDAWKKYQELSRLLINSENRQKAFVVGWLFLALENLFSSMKLFVQGYTIPSGNLMRQSIEGIAMATLCSLNENIKIKRKKKGKWEIGNFYEAFQNNKRETQAHNALKCLENNKSRLKLNSDMLDILFKMRKHNHNYSHPSQLGLGATVWFECPEKLFIGGGYDNDKTDQYKAELISRIGFCKLLPPIIDWLIFKTKNLPGK